MEKLKNTLGDTVGGGAEGNTKGTEWEKEEVALKKEAGGNAFSSHKKVRRRTSAPEWSDTHVASRCQPTSMQRGRVLL